MVDILIGLGLAAVTVGSARLAGFDRDSAFYPTILAVIALLYVLFGVMDARVGVIVSEGAVALVFVALAVAGFKRSVWWLVAGYAIHGVWDLVHDAVITNNGVPVWWPHFCIAYDGAIAAYLALRARKPAAYSPPVQAHPRSGAPGVQT
ncbi:MAG: hypothetical protein AAGI71_13015 [Bacteroidota bacterium]